MLYRKLPKTGEEISALGYGVMRLPMTGDRTNSEVDYAAAEKLVRTAYENGVNYFDGAYIYLGQKAEAFMAKALKPVRDKVKIATKMPPGFINDATDFDKIFNTMIERLDGGYIDFFLMHGFQTYEAFDRLRKLGLLEFLEKIRKSDKVRYVGFSSHSNEKQFEEIIDAYDWDFTQIQYNYLDTRMQAGTEGLEYAAKKGLGVMIMEPIRGGLLADIQDEEKLALIGKDTTPAEMALRFVLDRPEVTCVLSGMKTMDEVTQNIATASKYGVGNLSVSEKANLEKVAEIFRSQVPVGCTGCGYCMPCPFGVDIPQCFEAYIEASITNYERGKGAYNQRTGKLGDDPRDASLCQKCGLCETKCPQSIKIREKLEEVNKYFG
ncbi:MAG: aldo/keto reductase [Christensenellaceae bacterium]|nr:aldo/keto reductase [Christensenellaceae bacterium]